MTETWIIVQLNLVASEAKHVKLRTVVWFLFIEKEF